MLKKASQDEIYNPGVVFLNLAAFEAHRTVAKIQMSQLLG